MAEALWYYEDGGKPAGPVNEAALVEAIRQGRLARGQRVWTAGQPGWLAWEAVPALAEQAPAPVPPPEQTPAQVPGGRPAASGWGAPASVEPGPAWSPPPPAAGPAGTGPLRLYPRAPLGPRFVAALVDGLVGAGPLGIALALFALTSSGDWSGGGAAGLLAALVVAAGLWALYYGFTKDGRAGGQSIGKRMMQLMVVHLPTNRPCSLQQSALRALVQTVLQLVPYVGWLVEPTAVVIAAGGRRLGDQAAGTQVILASDYRPAR